MTIISASVFIRITFVMLGLKAKIMNSFLFTINLIHNIYPSGIASNYRKAFHMSQSVSLGQAMNDNQHAVNLNVFVLISSKIIIGQVILLTCHIKKLLCATSTVVL